MTTGGSHTNFNTAAFGAGAFGGALSLGGAVAQGLINGMHSVRSQRQAAWNEATWERALQLSELLHKRTLDRAVRAETDNTRLRAENVRLRGAPRLAIARAMLRS